ncbi:baseplate J/gp47 family protein [Sphingomonas sp.]|jgi:phage-related baseplate assembly protein|uniref:baseplate assembly protein n=1 Tax=Sphingomonas sp. TaxID=28214 RepID=UPI003568089E
MADMAVTSSISSSVDLSRLPPPTVVEQLSYEAIYGEILASLTKLLPSFDATVESDPAVKILQVAAYRELLNRQKFNDRIRQVMIAYATQTNLDHLAAIMGVARLELAPADPDTGAAAVMEGDDDLRRRVVLAPESFSVAGPEGAYIFHALAADATIRDASAISPAPGQVLVSVLSRTGNGVASPDQIAAVSDRLAAISGNKVRPLTDQVAVASATVVPYMIDAALTLYSGPDETVVLAAAQKRLGDWLALSGGLGIDAVRAAIIAALFVEGVQNVALHAPAADVVVDQTQSAHCVGLSVTVAGRDA